jgi:hypothetical protein
MINPPMRRHRSDDEDPRFPIALAVAAFTLVGVTSAFADPEINGVALNTTVANGNTNAAIGLLSEACQAVGAVGEACDD